VSGIPAGPAYIAYGTGGSVAEISGRCQLQGLTNLQIGIRWRNRDAAQSGFNEEAAATGQSRY
jgi:hypothetical protein